MKRILRMRKTMTGLVFGAVVFALSAVPAFATAPTVPAIPVSSYGDSLLSGLGTAVTAVFPYAAAITAFAIGVGLVRRWLGAKKATRV
jgi:hypoxanthine-guanine phosphoribosyltransferase